MACQYYKNCYAYDAAKEACSKDGDCSIYDLFNIEREQRLDHIPIPIAERMSIKAGLEILAIDESVKQKQKNVSTKK